MPPLIYFTLRRLPQFSAAITAGLLCLPSLLRASAESDTVLENLGFLEWIGGINSQVPDNSSEWKPEYEGQPATEVDLSEPHSATGDLLGNVYIADKNAHAIRVIGTDGRIRTVAGTNEAGFNGDGPATQRQLDGPQNAYPMPDGSFYILDTGNKRIRKVSPSGQMTTVIIETDGLSRGLWVKRDGSLIYYCTNTSLRRWTPAFGTNPGVIIANGFSECGNIDVALNGDIYVTDRGAATDDPTASQVFRVASNATPVSFVPQRVAGTGGTNDSGREADGTPALNTGLRGVRGIAFHPAGGYFLATHKGGDIWYVDTGGIIHLIVRGDDGKTHTTIPQPLPATGNTIAEPRFVSVAPNGDLLMATNDAGFIRRARYLGPVPNPPVLTILPPDSAGGPVALRFDPPEESWYRLESTNDPAAPVWAPRLIGPSTGYPLEWTDPVGTAVQKRQSYRLRLFRSWPN